MLILPPGQQPPSDIVIVSAGTPKDTEIILHTSKRQSIANTQYAELGTCDLATLRRMAAACNGRERSAISPRYNCHGLTFASRRTCIDETEEVWKVIHDDGYTVIQMEEVLPGDIVLYLGEGGDIDHSATVVQAARYEQGRLIGFPLVMGKWGKYKEVIHPANMGPYSHANVKYYRCNHDAS